MHNTGSTAAGMSANAELDWLAFRYITGELSAVDGQAFEARLESDLDACEAVARAVQLVETLALGVGSVHKVLAMPVVEVQSDSMSGLAAGNNWRTARRWALTAVSGAAALVVIGVLSLRTEPRVEMVEPSVVEIWADSWHADGEPEPVAVEIPNADLADADDLVAPGWLMAAVQGDPATISETDDPEATTDQQEN